jgi:ribosomal subunit interface protein
MRIEIQAEQFAMPHGLQDYVQQRVAFALGRFSSVVWRVAVGLTAVEVPFAATQCRVSATLRSGGEVTCDETASDTRVAIDRAVDRLGRAVDRDVRRRLQPQWGALRKHAEKPDGAGHSAAESMRSDADREADDVGSDP